MQINLLIKLKGWMTYIEQCGKEVPHSNVMVHIMCLASPVRLESDKAQLHLWVVIGSCTVSRLSFPIVF